MPSSDDHLAWASKAFAEAEALANRHHEWAVVAMFYAALHMVHAFLPLAPGVTYAHQHPETHGGQDGTNTIVRRHLPEIDDAYRSLYDASIDVRYHGGRVSHAVAHHHRHDDLPVIGSYVCNKLHGADCDCWMRAL